MLNARDIKMRETVAALKEYVIRIRMERVEVERPLGKLLQSHPYLSPWPLERTWPASAASPCIALPD